MANGKKKLVEEDLQNMKLLNKEELQSSK